MNRMVEDGMSVKRKSLRVLYLTGPGTFTTQKTRLSKMGIAKKSPFDAAMASMKPYSVAVEFMALKSWNFLSWPAQALKALFYLDKYDVVFTPGLFLVPPRILLRWKKPRLLVLIERLRTNTASDRILMPIIRSCIGKIDRTLCLSSLQVASHSSDLKVSTNKIVSAHYGIDAEFFGPETSQNEGFILCVGDAFRDDATLIRATEGMPVKVVRVSDNLKAVKNFRKLLDALSDSSSRKAQFISLCGINDFQLKKLYAKSALIIVCIRSKTNQPAGLTALLEGMAMGKPVIVTKSLASKDYVIDGKTGIIIEPGNSAQLQNVISKLLDDPLNCRRLGLAARKSVEENFTIENLTANLVNVLFKSVS